MLGQTKTLKRPSTKPKTNKAPGRRDREFSFIAQLSSFVVEILGRYIVLQKNCTLKLMASAFSATKAQKNTKTPTKHTHTQQKERTGAIN